MALDEPTHAFFATRVRHCALFVNRDAHYDAGASSFNTLAFRSLCHQKVFLVSQLLAVGVHVLWTDTDIVWLDDALAALDAAERAGPTTADGAHLQFADAIDEWPNWAAKWRVALAPQRRPVDLLVQCDDDGLCAGFFLVRANAATIDYMNQVIQSLC